MVSWLQDFPLDEPVPPGPESTRRVGDIGRRAASSLGLYVAYMELDAVASLAYRPASKRSRS